MKKIGGPNTFLPSETPDAMAMHTRKPRKSLVDGSACVRDSHQLAVCAAAAKHAWCTAGAIRAQQ